ncbi:glycosyltransferase 87 family protein [Glycomyces salinus]|uniref:glycosyltransferase 87 family protein n=1 Tax=Glycomyces salinus TaxID=980294 RepID=UPI0018EDB4F6|nr:glycosyltransferase 87 family protein [Glycomyces salinus]
MSKRPLLIDLVFYASCALFAGATALWSTLTPHQHWGAIAVGGYGPAAVVAAMLVTQLGVTWFKRALVAGATAAAVTAMPLLVQAFERAGGVEGRFQEEVLVVESSANRLLQDGSPYLSAEAIVSLPEPLLGYNPYQPGMAVFGLPAAVFGHHWWTDARLYFALAAAACLIGAVALLRGLAGKGPMLRALQASVVFPVCALTFATGGDDMPVAALAVLALAFAARGRFLATGLAVGAAASLKLFAWPVAIVIGILVWRQQGQFMARELRQEGLRRYLLGFAAPVAVTMLPVVLTDPRGFADNVLAFGLGHGVVESPAQSPLPGHLIAQHVPGGELIAPALLFAAGCAIAVLIARRPPLTSADAALWAAGGLTAAFLLMPATRFGYLLYPVILLGWWLPLRDAAAARSDGPGPSLAVEWWR